MSKLSLLLDTTEDDPRLNRVRVLFCEVYLASVMDVHHDIDKLAQVFNDKVKNL
jgi:hypothetical protein